MTTVTKEPVVLEGYQSFFQESQFGKKGLQAILPQELIDQLEEERPGMLDWAKSKCKAKRPMERNEPWEEVSDGMYQVKFSWKPEIKIPIVDAEGTPIEDEIPLYSGSTVKLAFDQKPYATPDMVGTRLVLKAVQIITLSSSAGVDVGSLNDTSAAALFGKSEGFKVNDPNIHTPNDKETTPEGLEDF